MEEVNVRRVIGRKVFDTATATEVMVVARVGGMPGRDFDCEWTALYRSQHGQYFLAGQGGALTRWGKRANDGGRCHGDGIKLLSDQEVRALMEELGGPVEVHFACEEG